MREAVDQMSDRLRIRLERAARNWEAIRGGKPVPLPHEWRHQSRPSSRKPYFPRPPEERKVIRHKAYTLARQTPDEAITEPELLDYDFHLFTEHATGQDSVIYRTRLWAIAGRSTAGSAAMVSFTRPNSTGSGTSRSSERTLWTATFSRTREQRRGPRSAPEVSARPSCSPSMPQATGVRRC